MREPLINASACTALYDGVEWNNPYLVASLVVLLLITVMVVVGNCLVIAAVFMSSKLRTVTNLFIVSLAVADLMVGLAVLPFSATWEVFKVWVFGDIWCSIWLAVDVWMCTASILNLCAISLDRYVAVTRPVTYPSIMSSGRAKLLIAGVWVLSFVICFPPLVGWKDAKDADSEQFGDEQSGSNRIRQRNFNETNSLSEEISCPWICELTNDAGYVVYSALGSFYIPMFVMLFFYWRIYRAAVQTTKAINQGFRTTKGSRLLGNRFDEQRLTLRIHRGRSVMQGHHSNGSNSTATTASNSPGGGSHGKSPEASRLNRSSANRNFDRHNKSNERVKISVSYPSTETLCSTANNNGINESAQSSKKNSITSDIQLYSVHYNNTNQSQVFKPRDHHLRVSGHRMQRRKSSTGETTDLSPSPTFDESTANKPKLISKMGKRNIKAQVKRFRMETKAAKTLGIIVGGFIVCWLPFFTMYLVRAFCVSCIHPMVFSVLFWLGYCNSAINPCIYALFSKDFRFAFKRIICRCLCGKKREQNRNASRRRGSDGSQLGRQQAYQQQYRNTSQGDDSDPNNEGSDSR